VRGLHELMRDVLLLFATLEWLSLAPDVVAGFEDTVQALGLGVLIREAFPNVFHALPASEILGTALSTSQSSASLPSSQLLLESCTLSSGSTVTNPPPPPSPSQAPAPALAVSWGTPSVSSSTLRWCITEGNVRVGITKRQGKEPAPETGLACMPSGPG
jgi:hypothetical protein